jgi:GT2 family glycosyltransferase
MPGSLLDLTVIISNCNTRALLRNCLESVYRYTSGITFEVICVDDASSDGSADMVADEFPDVMLVRNPVNKSYARNCNRGIRMSRAPYVCLLDSDTMLIRNTLAALVQFMDKHPEAAVCGPKLLNPDGSVQHHIRSFAGLSTFGHLMDRYYNTDFDYTKAQQVQSIGTSVYMIRRSTWERAGMLDECFRLAVVDLSYNYMLNQKGYKVFFTPCTEAIHFGGQSINQNIPASLLDQRRALIDFSSRYNYFGKGRLMKAIVHFGIEVRYYSKILGYHLTSDKRVIKGPGAPTKEVAALAALISNPANGAATDPAFEFEADLPPSTAGASFAESRVERG